jgi:protein subunit release factor A
MSTHDVTIKAFEEKINAQLEQAKAQLAELGARAKGNVAQAEIDTIHHLKTKHQEIEKKRQVLKTTSDAKAGQIKAEIEAEIAKLKTSLAELNSKLRLEPRTKAS